MSCGAQPTTIGDYLFSGPWLTEAEGVQALIEAAKPHFRAYVEVPGRYIALRPGVERRDPRADVLLLPTVDLVNRGWDHGIVGVEAKKPGEKAGKAVSQVLDYTLAVFSLPQGYEVSPKWWMLWHLEGMSGAAESIATQNRIGCACFTYGGGIKFKLGGMNLFDTGRFGRGGTDLRTSNEVLSGRKVGSR
jgi:hypothetical protein